MEARFDAIEAVLDAMEAPASMPWRQDALEAAQLVDFGISIKFVDGRVVTVLLPWCATVLTIAQRASAELRHPAHRIRIVRAGATEPLAHEHRLRNIIHSPSVFYALPELLAEWALSGEHIDLSANGQVATCNTAPGGVACCAGELFTGEEQWTIRPRCEGESTAVIGARCPSDNLETLVGMQAVGYFVTVTSEKSGGICVDGVAAPRHFSLSFVAKLGDDPELLVYMTYPHNHLGAVNSGGAKQLLRRWRVRTPLVRAAGLCVVGQGRCSVTIEDAPRLPQRFTTPRWHCDVCGWTMRAVRTRCTGCSAPKPV